MAGRLILAMLDDDVSALGGPTLGADPLLGAVAVHAYLQDRRQLKLFIMRKTAKAYGRNRLIEGPEISQGERAVVLDDVATSGQSLLECVQVLRKQGVIVDRAIVLIDRQEGAGRLLSDNACRLESVFTADELRS